MSIKHWPLEDRPCEKLLRQGEEALTDAELIAIFIRTGIRGQTALDIARKSLMEHGGLKNLLAMSTSLLIELPGIGPIKCATLKAAIELGKRYIHESVLPGESLASSQRVQHFIAARLGDYQHEVFACLFLDRQLRLISFEELFQGTLHEAIIYPREIVKQALTQHAAKVIIAHNHPSGDPTPSASDKAVTKQIKAALSLIDIDLIDHIIIGHGTQFSFADQGWL